MEKKDKKQNVFDINDFKPITTEKYKSCVSYNEMIPAETLTTMYRWGWKLIHFSAFAKSKTIGYSTQEGVGMEVYAYMFENKRFMDDIKNTLNE